MILQIHEPQPKILKKEQSFQQGVSWIGASEIKGGSDDAGMLPENIELETKDQQQPLHPLQVLVPGWSWWHTVVFNGCSHSWTSRMHSYWFPSVRRSWWRNPLGGLTIQALARYWSLSKCLPGQRNAADVSLTFSVNIYKLLGWKTYHCFQAKPFQAQGEETHPVFSR